MIASRRSLRWRAVRAAWWFCITSRAYSRHFETSAAGRVLRWLGHFFTVPASCVAVLVIVLHAAPAYATAAASTLIVFVMVYATILDRALDAAKRECAEQVAARAVLSSDYVLQRAQLAERDQLIENLQCRLAHPPANGGPR